ncbi:hypothetical protein Desdi_0743 [Desulfitobacterium dichloroeliminans LMG P-21439]|uniref:Uncharacterized protein n=1 Tax=Desulfitobacterium dichloroeliminans (strain LMG P-21439 / DCA1) TaxID=871963 RepID=L0F5F0_DESDL|nr:hypothetical protein [Desulfitobacterium dichloroeliminans]AGA68270.1 hypothetical protein Desdi_0743 [Desulfitobacterium dichloroeliminans LMG P-21439]
MIHLVDPEVGGTYCADCHNRIVSEYLGYDFEKIEFKPLKIKDAYGKKHTFHFETVLVPSGMAIEADERLKVDNEGYEFSILGDFDCDQGLLQLMLIQRIRRALKQKHLEKNEINKSYNLAHIVRGRIGHDHASDGQSIVIDGKSFSLDELGRMLMTYEGFQFRLEFIDSSDEVK